MIYIIIPVYNRKKLTKNCLLSLQKQTYKDFIPVVIDDGSTDGTSEMIKRYFNSFVKLLISNGNLWWAGATNLGIKYVLKDAKSDDFILTLNNDLIVEPNYLQELINCYKKYPSSLIGSLTLFKDNPERVVYGGGIWNKLTAKQKRHFKIGGEFKSGNTPEVLSTDFLPGRGTLIPINVFRTIGLYDNINFPHYAADQDLALRAKKRGYNLYISMKAKVYSIVEETGINFIYSKPTISSFLNSFFSIRSSSNLKIKLRFVRKHLKFWFIYFLFDLIRITYSFLKNIFNYYLKRRIYLKKFNSK